MILYNTTFHVEMETYDEFVEFLKSNFIPASIKSGLLSSPRLSHVVDDKSDEGLSIALEFKVINIDTLNEWHRLENEIVYRPMFEKFKDRFIGFSTILQMIDI